ncbi:MAG: S4 domain-containing protein, partial [Nanoarchaeota archaeon]
MRLQVYLARSGYGSRRKCEDLIREGRVRVNSFVANLGMKVADKDKVELDGYLVSMTDRKIYVMLNKPRDYLVSKGDE